MHSSTWIWFGCTFVNIVATLPKIAFANRQEDISLAWPWFGVNLQIETEIQRIIGAEIPRYFGNKIAAARILTRS